MGPAAVQRAGLGPATRSVTGFTLPAAMVANAQVQSPNLLVNPGAEMSTPSDSGFSAVSMPGWTVTGTWTVIKHGTPKVCHSASRPLPDLPSIWSFLKASAGPRGRGQPVLPVAATPPIPPFLRLSI